MICISADGRRIGIQWTALGGRLQVALHRLLVPYLVPSGVEGQKWVWVWWGGDRNSRIPYPNCSLRCESRLFDLISFTFCMFAEKKWAQSDATPIIRVSLDEQTGKLPWENRAQMANLTPIVGKLAIFPCLSPDRLRETSFQLDWPDISGPFMRPQSLVRPHLHELWALSKFAEERFPFLIQARYLHVWSRQPHHYRYRVTTAGAGSGMLEILCAPSPEAHVCGNRWLAGCFLLSSGPCARCKSDQR